MSAYSIPNVGAQHPRGDRIMDVYSHLLTERVVYLDTGFGLLRPLTRLNAPPIELGDSTALTEKTRVLVVGPDGPSPALVVSRREFAGYWEYLLPDAIFTSPPYQSFGGAALIGGDGRLLGIGSLIVADAAASGEQLPGNMFVPVSALKPIMADLFREGRSAKAHIGRAHV